MQGEMTPNGERFECIIDGNLVIVYLYAGVYIGYPKGGGSIRSHMTEAEVVAGIEAKTAADIEAYNQHAPHAALSQGSYYGD